MMDPYRQKIMGFLKHYKIPPQEYSFSGKTGENQTYVLQKGFNWEVHTVRDGEDKLRGVFRMDLDAIDFMYYLVMKDHVKVKKCWW